MAGYMYLGSQRVCPVIVSGGGGEDVAARYIFSDGVLSQRSGELTGDEFKNITDISDSAFCYAFYKSAVTGNLDLSSVKTIGQSGMESSFESSGITSVDLSSLKTVSDSGLKNAFSATKVESADLSSLEVVDGGGMENTFNATYIESINLPSLKIIYGFGFVNTFNSSYLQTVRLPLLNKVGMAAFQGAFNDCWDLKDIYFNSLSTDSFTLENKSKTAFNIMFDNFTAYDSATGHCTVHFPSNMQETISGLAGYPLFGDVANRLLLAFDLRATE